MSADWKQFVSDHPEWSPYADLLVSPPTGDELIIEYSSAEGTEIARRAEEMTSYGVTRGAIYFLSRLKGQSHRFAEMAALTRPPRPNTDDVQFHGIQRVANMDNNPYLKSIVAKAKQQGFTPPADAIYHSGLARFPGDREAFVTPEMGRGYIRRICESRGWGAEGDISIAHRQPNDDPLSPKHCVPMAEDIIRANTEKLIRKDPGLQNLKRQELRARVLQQYGPSSS